MLMQHTSLVVFKAYGEEEGNPEPGAQPEVDLSNPAIQALLKAERDRHAQELTGLKNKNSEILGELKADRDKRKAFESQIQDKEDLEAYKAGKLDITAFSDKRVNAATESYKQILGEKDTSIQDLEKKLQESDMRIKRMHVSQTIGQLVLANEFVHKEAAEDISEFALREGEIDANGNLVFRDEYGNVKLGRDGKPLQGKEWLDGLLNRKKYLAKDLPGSGGKQGTGGSGRTMTKGEWQKQYMNASEKEAKELRAKREKGEIVIV
ncbi:Hypothetical protein, conserved [Pseudomonas putida BIRD-1]|uniref:hypothetical protein n=1 Tax=Pseudomonas putida TaxID=303 RepID=UPI0001F3210D|nr:hypothetical protein [Pseudomonas putida]ADR59579.1 Hypothetical protein, conserved [Pseudomonas putida BIRD-1]